MPESQHEEAHHKKKLKKLVPFIILCTVIAFVFLSRHRGFFVEHPRTFDESLYTWFGIHLIQHPADYSAKRLYGEAVRQGLKFSEAGTNFLTLPLYKHPPLFAHLLKLFILMTMDVDGAMIVPPLMNCVVVVFAYLFARRAYGEFTAIITILLLAIDPISWIPAQKTWMTTTLGAFMMGGLLAFLMAIYSEEKTKTVWFVMAGLIFGLAVNVKYTAFAFIVGSFIYASLFEVNLLKRKGIWLIPVITAIAVAPWAAWNWQVYGSDGVFMRVWRGLTPGHSALQELAVLFCGIFALSIASIFILKRLPWKSSGQIENVNRNLRLKRLFVLCGSLFLIALVSQARFREGFISMLRFNSLPTGGTAGGFFRGEPWSFYFARFLEFSPFYLLPYFIFFQPFFFKYGFSKGDKLLIAQAAFFLASVVLWKNYQCRYAVHATILLLILSARILSAWWQYAQTLESARKRRFMKAAWIAFVSFAAVKTFIVDILFVMPNQMTYY